MEAIKEHQCNRDGCVNTAKWQLTLRIWLMAIAPSNRCEGNCINMLTSVIICEECKPIVNAKDFLTSESRVRISAVVFKVGGELIDYGSAKLQFEEIVDKPEDVNQIAADAARAGVRVIEG